MIVRFRLVGEHMESQHAFSFVVQLEQVTVIPMLTAQKVWCVTGEMVVIQCLVVRCRT